jgi:hypothetical protein
MAQAYRIYCDESCHLEHDRCSVMVLGAVWCPSEAVPEISKALREIKVRHGLSPNFELKWGKVSPAQVGYYTDVANYFFEETSLRFRCLIAPKEGLRHDDFDQSHDSWYYKMYYLLLRRLLAERENEYRVYIDIKDTNSAGKVRLLHEVLCNSMRDFDHNVLRDVQALPSDEVQQIQLADFLSGAVSYASRNLRGSAAKQQIVNAIQTRTRHDLISSTWYSEKKFNIFKWEPQRDETR